MLNIGATIIIFDNDHDYDIVTMLAAGDIVDVDDVDVDVDADGDVGIHIDIDVEIGNTIWRGRQEMVRLYERPTIICRQSHEFPAKSHGNQRTERRRSAVHRLDR